MSIHGCDLILNRLPTKLLYCALIFPMYLFSGFSQASESNFGIGVGVNDSISLQFPIQVDNLLIEPSIAYFKSDSSVVDNDGSRSTFRERTNLTLSVGIYINKLIEKDTGLYFGAKIGYRVSDRKSTRINSSSTNFVSNSESDGYVIAPTVGVYYNFAENFSIGLDLEIEYSKLSGDDQTGTSVVLDTEITAINTSGVIVLRYFF